MTNKRSGRLVYRGHQALRAGVGLVALVALGFAGYCTLESDNEVGTAAAYLVGLYFSVIAITGRVPKLKWGDNELDPTSVAIGAAAVAEVAQKEAETTDDPKEVAAAASEASHFLIQSKWTDPAYVWSGNLRLLQSVGDSEARLRWADLVNEAVLRLHEERKNPPDDPPPPDPVGAPPKR